MNRLLSLPFLLLSVINVSAQKSLDAVDAQSWADAKSPMTIPATEMRSIKVSAFGNKKTDATISLDGNWTLTGKDGKGDHVEIKAAVPGSIHAALRDAGVIPAPCVGRNDTIAERCSYRTWTLTRTFIYKGELEMPRLEMDGVANKCTVRLNGQTVCDHEGMFGIPSQPVGNLLKKGENTLEVTLHPIPETYNGGWPATANEAWKHTVVANCVYGWHYSKIPSMGIWNSVRLVSAPNHRITDPFIATRSTNGDMRLLFSTTGEFDGEVRLKVTPASFKGIAQAFSSKISSKGGLSALDFHIANPQLWHPNDIGPQNLYDAEIQLLVKGKVVSVARKRFGIRTIEMLPFPEGEKPDLYNWTFSINGRKQFVKGTGWCTMDAMLDLSAERYRRFLTVAKQQHCQIIRAWGGGLPETETFYDLCDSLGIMVIQEWPTAWNSHNTQPYDMLEETVRLNTLRLRNHPSLVMWGGGNESEQPYGKAINMMGRYSVELDGTRPFHRAEAWGGSRHNYNCWWDEMHLNHNLNMTARFWGEFGIPSLPCVANMERYLNNEVYSWPPSKESIFTHHTPIFGTNGEISRLGQYAGYFMPLDSLKDVVFGSQMAQVIGIRHTLERARTMWPETTGALYYKLNDNFPGLSWSTVDYYGGIKPAHYFARRAFEPATTVLLFDRTNICGQDVSLPYYMLDDNEAWKGSKIKAHLTVYNHRMKCVLDTIVETTAEERVVKLADIPMTAEQTLSEMLWFKTDLLSADSALIARNWYFSNYETRRGVMLQSEKATVTKTQTGETLTITNTSDIPAVGVTINVDGEENTLTLSDNYLWLDAHESVTIKMNTRKEATMTWWNK